MEEGREENKLMDRSIDRPRTNSTQDRLETETYDVQVKSGGAKKKHPPIRPRKRKRTIETKCPGH